MRFSNQFPGKPALAHWIFGSIPTGTYGKTQFRGLAKGLSEMHRHAVHRDKTRRTFYLR